MAISGRENNKERPEDNCKPTVHTEQRGHLLQDGDM
jgi:hypothetical protein